MKKEDVKKILLTLIGISVFFVIIGFVSCLDFAGECFSLYKRAMDYGYSTLQTFTIIQLVLACLIAACFVTLLIINLSKLKMRQKRLINIIMLSSIIALSVIMAIVLMFLKANDFSRLYDYAYLLEYIRSVLSYIVPAVIFSVAMFIWLFSDKVFKNLSNADEQKTKIDSEE